MDSDSIRLAGKFMRRQYRCPRNGFMIHPKYFYEQGEKSEYAKIRFELRRTAGKFHLSGLGVGPESLYYHHGLRFAPDSVKRNVSGKVFADVGGWMGDSALAFAGYSPLKIAVFEPFEENRNSLRNILNRNRIPESLYEIFPFALSDRRESVNGMECRTLDSFFHEETGPLGVIKADVEGMGLKVLAGAENVIRRDRPLLSLSIYHNEDEFAGIYRMLKSWNIHYHCEIKQFSPLVHHGEYSLFAYPEEWVRK